MRRAAALMILVAILSACTSSQSAPDAPPPAPVGDVLTLEASGQAVALVARSGLDLDRFAVRYSHAGVSLRDSPNTPWSVRQLYFACEERAPRLYDQGLAGFVQGTRDAFGSAKEIRAAARRAQVHALEGADHSLRLGGDPDATRTAREEAAALIVGFLQEVRE